MLLPLVIFGGLAALLLAARSASGASPASSASSIVLHPGDQPATAEQKQHSAALALRAYLRSSGDFGSKSKPSTRVRALQAQMGEISADGIDGPKTEARAKKLGVTLPTRPAAKTHLTATSKAPALFPPDRPPASPASKPAAKTAPSIRIGPAMLPSSSTGTSEQYAAARALNAYLRTDGADFGSKAQPSTKVRTLQAQMGRIAADGDVGPETTARAKALGQTLPARPAARRPMLTSPLALPPSTPAAKPAAVAAKPAPTAAKPPAAAPAAKAAAAATSTPATNAARALDAYLQGGGRDRARIADLQWQLGLDTDGIPGPGTRSAVQRELGTAYGKWPDIATSQLTGSVPGGSSKREAAERLERYYNLPGSSRSATRIAAYQKVLGVAADGKVGPQTRSAATAALGRAAKL